MSDRPQRKIEVKPGQLVNLIADVETGRYRIPQFQREYVWSKSKVRELFDSIYREFPIGSFFLWDAERRHNHLFRQLVDLGIPAVGDTDDVSFILDGQQRITSLYVTLKGLTVNGTDYRNIVFDLKEEAFKDRSPDNKRYVSVSDIWGPEAMRLSRYIDEGYVDAYDRCYQVLRTYPTSIVEVRDKELPDVCKIFRRINQAGKRLDRFDLISAMTFTSDFDLRERFKKDIKDRLEDKLFGGISAAMVTQLLALVKHGLCTERYEYSLTADDIQGYWKDAVAGILLAADTLRKNMGVVNADYLPYGAFLTLLAYYYMKSGNRGMPSEHLEWAKQWFWRASFGQYYGSAGPTKMSRDKDLFDKLIAGEQPVFDVPLRLTVQDLVKTRMTWTRTALRNAFMCLLATCKPLDLRNNTPLDLVAGGISDFTNNEKHHIFPRAFLKRSGPENAEIHALPNFCFLTAELNKRILDNEPATYIPELQKENAEFGKAARSHLLPLGLDSGLLDNDYLKFLKARGQLLLDEIGRLCGEISTPRQEERQEAIEQLETAIRDCIHEVLSHRVGDNYWKSNVPPAVRDGAEKRIQLDIAKHPDLKAEEFNLLRRKLDYVNVMDYRTIIENGANWPHFEPIFRRKQDLQNYLEQFSEYRNCIMHSRPMSELTRMGGETAMIWFESVLPSVEPVQNGEEEDNE
ncbi:MAG: DUF262 domain-containing protein [Thermoguttaceae bacterium]|jgi:hypothetical protein|nr:DUF262 domain-containing protein [Thermoguttaceae bacterium]